MHKFFFSHISQNKFRSFSLIFSVAILFFVLIFGIFLQKNITSAIEYYATHGNNEHRVTLSTSQNSLSIFQKDKGMNENLVNEILGDELLENIQIFRLVHTPVTAKFWFFTFSLESDVPVFSVTDSALSGAKIPVGMSRTMLDLYNTQMAGSSTMFPKMRENFLIGQKIEFTFGKSKIFQSSNTIAKPIIGTITTINNDFPGLGLVLPESIVREKMRETGYEIGSPYKIVAYIKNLSDRAKIEEKYKNISVEFEIDEITETKQKIIFIEKIFGVINLFIIGLFAIFFAFLLSGIFRERKYIFEMISLFWLRSKKSYFMTLSEPIIFSVIGVLFGGIFGKIFLTIVEKNLWNILEEKGILFPIIPLSYAEIIIFGGIIFLWICIFIGILEFFARKKYQFRS